MEMDSVDRIEKPAGQGVVPSYAWVILAVVMAAGVAGPFNQFKVPPVMPVLMDSLGIDLTYAGALMSIFAITGLITALPAGLVLLRLGLKLTGLIAILFMLGGTLLGAVAGRYSLLFISRLVEGVGLGLIAVIGPAAISAWYPEERRGFPMGIWATWVSLGSLLIYNLAPPVKSAGGWQSVWWMSAGLTAAAAILFFILFREPSQDLSIRPKHKTVGSPAYIKALSRPGIWLLSFAFGCFNFAIIGVIATYYPTYLKSIQGYDLAGASLVTSIKMIVVIATAPLIGWVVDRIGSPRKITLWSFIAIAAFMALPFSISGWMIPASMVLLGILAGAIPTCIFTSIPEIVGWEAPAGIGMGVILIGQNLGQLLGPVVFGQLVQTIGWMPAAFCTIPLLLAGYFAVRLTDMK